MVSKVIRISSHFKLKKGKGFKDEAAVCIISDKDNPKKTFIKRRYGKC